MLKIPVDNSIKPYLYKLDNTLYKKYKNYYLQNRFVNFVRLEEFMKLTKRFPNIVLLKGLDLALNYYSCMGVREFEDIDIIIDVKMRKYLENYFVDNGYRRFYRNEKLNSFEYYKDITKFHVHTSLYNAVYPQPYFEALNNLMNDHIIDTELSTVSHSYRNGSKEIENGNANRKVEGLMYKRLEENFNFIYITLHSLKHNFDKSIRLFDIFEVSKRVNWQKVYQISKKSGCYKLLINTLNMLYISMKNNNILSKILFANSNFIKNHSGLDLFMYFYTNPHSVIPFLLKLSNR